uniref:Uncharacterized protein n=1 Tax=Tetranychus urticae TaxID=32264 RepID=T1KEA0_TETUR
MWLTRFKNVLQLLMGFYHYR